MLSLDACSDSGGPEFYKYAEAKEVGALVLILLPLAGV